MWDNNKAKYSTINKEEKVRNKCEKDVLLTAGYKRNTTSPTSGMSTTKLVLDSKNNINETEAKIKMNCLETTKEFSSLNRKEKVDKGQVNNELETPISTISPKVKIKGTNSKEGNEYKERVSTPKRMNNLSNVENNTMKQDTEIIHSNDRSKDTRDYNLTNTTVNNKMKHSFKVKRNINELQSIPISNVEMQKENQLIVKDLPLQTNLKSYLNQ